jgi:hypothetical protein
VARNKSNAAKHSHYLPRSFAREAVRDKLRQAKVHSVRDIPCEDVEALIAEYLAKHPGPHFASEIADMLALDF